MSKELENAWAVQEIWQDKCYKLEEENKKLKEEIDTGRSVLSSYIRQYQRIKSQIYAINDVKNVALKKVEKLEAENKKLKNLKICGKTVEERIEIDKGVVRGKY